MLADGGQHCEAIDYRRRVQLVNAQMLGASSLPRPGNGGLMTICFNGTGAGVAANLRASKS